MRRPTITLCLIMKNEEANIKRLHESIEGCFDEIHVTDTGSTDASVSVAQECGWKVSHFEWCDDFSAARSESIHAVTTDFWMWMDLDDVLENKEAFIRFRDHVMNVADFWLATYHYALNKDGAPVCSFSRERIMRTSKKFNWKYPVHEGVIPTSIDGECRVQHIPTWAVKHLRTEEDLKKDRSRNISILESHKDSLDPRLKYYYGKELFENGRTKEAYATLIDAVAETHLELHDRVLGLQYACYAGITERDFERVVHLAHNGLQLDPNRAEFHVIIGDCYVQMGNLAAAIPSYSAAKACRRQPITAPQALFSHGEAYGIYPTLQIPRLLANMGDLETARREAYEALDKFQQPEVQQFVNELETVRRNTAINYKAPQTDDIVITCMMSPYEWDADLYKERAMGGSETAAIEMARWLRKLSGRPVKVFNMRASPKTCDGVEYIPHALTCDWMKNHRPYAHIAWRHNAKLTTAPTHIWCHDLMTPGVENQQNYESVLCLTPFHKNYLSAMQGVPDKKIRVTRNGIDPEKFKDVTTQNRNPNKVLFTSSPDRGLDRAMLVCDLAREKLPDLELHVFYGIEHLEKYGLHELQNRLRNMMEFRPYVKYHGATKQTGLVAHMKDASTWLYPSDWIETSCITAMEMVCAGVYPIVRAIGGVVDTLKYPHDHGMCTLVNMECTTDDHRRVFADGVVDAVTNRLYQSVAIDPRMYSWESVAREWLEWL